MVKLFYGQEGINQCGQYEILQKGEDNQRQGNTLHIKTSSTIFYFHFNILQFPENSFISIKENYLFPFIFYISFIGNRFFQKNPESPPGKKQLHSPIISALQEWMAGKKNKHS